jgi:hypothetical protein
MGISLRQIRNPVVLIQMAIRSLVALILLLSLPLHAEPRWRPGEAGELLCLAERATIVIREDGKAQRRTVKEGFTRAICVRRCTITSPKTGQSIELDPATSYAQIDEHGRLAALPAHTGIEPEF